MIQEIMIVGIGNPYRGDDAAGWVVIDGLMKIIGSVIRLEKRRGDFAELIDIFSTYKTVYLVDACQSNGPLGDWQRIDLHHQPKMEERPQTSTHGFGIFQAISIAKNLGQLPNRIILYVINGNHYTMQSGLSSLVSKSVDIVIEKILNEEDIRSCMNKA